jgi:hypothetical protein
VKIGFLFLFVVKNCGLEENCHAEQSDEERSDLIAESKHPYRTA